MCSFVAARLSVVMVRTSRGEARKQEGRGGWVGHAGKGGGYGVVSSVPFCRLTSRTCFFVVVGLTLTSYPMIVATNPKLIVYDDDLRLSILGSGAVRCTPQRSALSPIGMAVFCSLCPWRVWRVELRCRANQHALVAPPKPVHANRSGGLRCAPPPHRFPQPSTPKRHFSER